MIHQFADITVDSAGMRVLKGSQPVDLEPKSLKVLLYLIEHRDRLVTKEELLQTIWQDTFVTDNALNRAIAQIRKALGDDAKQGRFIETVPRLGYRFIATAPDETVMEPVKPLNARRWLYGWAAALAITAAATMVWQTVKPKRAPPVKLTAQTQFTTSTGLDIYPAFSPDGTSLAYSSDESGSFEIYVKPLTRGARTLQVTADGRQNIQPAWSPDGRYLAYSSASEGGIWIVQALGGSPRKLTDLGTAPDWSPDGARLVFQDRAFTSLAGADQSCGSSVGGLWTVSVESGSPSQIPIPQDSDVCANMDPSWTAGGLIFFVRQTSAGARLCLIAPDGSSYRVLARVPGRRVITPRWSRERASIFFGTFTQDGNFTIRRLPVDGQGAATGPSEEVVDRSVGVPRTLDVARDGRHIAYSFTLPVSHIDSLPLNQGFEPSGPPAILTNENVYRYALPFISPDSRRLVFSEVRKGSNIDIWVSDMDGGNAHLVSVTPTNSFCSGWLPDGSGVSYTKYLPTATELWTASLRDGVERRLAQLPRDAMFPMLSPDGRYLVYHTAPTDLGMTLRKFELTTGRSTDLVKAESVHAGFGVWSRDSKQISFMIQHGSDDYLGVVPAEGGPFTQWTSGHGRTWASSWVDARTVIAAGQRDGVWNIYAITRGSERKLTNYTSLREYVRSARISPSNDRVVFEYNETKGNIYIGEL